jgi:hypothetical protein
MGRKQAGARGWPGGPLAPRQGSWAAGGEGEADFLFYLFIFFFHLFVYFFSYFFTMSNRIPY